MIAGEILAELQQRGVSVRADGESLYLKPRRAIDSDLLARVLEHKPEIVRALTAHPTQEREESREDTWPPECLDAEQRFGQPHAKLFSFIGRKVRTPAGHGTLLQVFAERVTVLLDSDLDKCAVFAPVDIEPVSWS